MIQIDPRSWEVRFPNRPRLERVVNGYLLPGALFVLFLAFLLWFCSR